LAFYEQAERRLDVIGLGRAIVFLDDTPSNIETATRHGWTGIHYRRDLDWNRAVTDALDRARSGAAPP
jgi:FMN phosphatase YigB (HAD superfamily)